jgi:hypothetical protein
MAARQRQRGRLLRVRHSSGCRVNIRRAPAMCAPAFPVRSLGLLLSLVRVVFNAPRIVVPALATRKRHCNSVLMGLGWPISTWQPPTPSDMGACYRVCGKTPLTETWTPSMRASRARPGSHSHTCCLLAVPITFLFFVSQRQLRVANHHPRTLTTPRTSEVATRELAHVNKPSTPKTGPCLMEQSGWVSPTCLSTATFPWGTSPPTRLASINNVGEFADRTARPPLCPLRRACSNYGYIRSLGKAPTPLAIADCPMLCGTPPVAPTMTFWIRRSCGLRLGRGGVLF